MAASGVTSASAQAHELVLGIEQREKFEMILLFVLPDRFRVDVTVWINEPPNNIALRKFALELLQFGGVTVGNGAIGSDEDKHERFGIIVPKWINQIAIGSANLPTERAIWRVRASAKHADANHPRRGEPADDRCESPHARDG